MAVTGERPHGVPKTKPRCPYCKVELVGNSKAEDDKEPNRYMGFNYIETDILSNGVHEGLLSYICMNCKRELPFFIGERVLRYWQNGGLRRKPGRKPKTSDESAA